MNQKQYADMTTIMQFGRIFADQIHKCMEHSGLLEQGFQFEIIIQNGRYLEDGCDYMRVELAKSICGVDEDEYKATAMEQCKFGRKDWYVYADPISKKGSLPTEVRIRSTDRQEETVCNSSPEGEKPYPPDGLWLSAYR